MASWGFKTMGSFSLNEVLSSTGTPVSFSNSLINAQYNGLFRRLTVWSRPVPSTWVGAGIAARFSGRTAYGLAETLTSLPEFKACAEGVKERCVDPPQRTDLSEIGSYGFFGT